jgi:hypothetical protein
LPLGETDDFVRQFNPVKDILEQQMVVVVDNEKNGAL